MKRKFIITADDYGVSPIIDKAIWQAVDMGIVSSVACFGNGTDKNGNPSMQSIVDLKQTFPHVEIGCHFTITSGKRMSTLQSDLGRKGKDNRKFRGRAFQHPERAKVTGGVDELVDELTAQLAAFKQAGLVVEHFSDHMGILSYTKRGMTAMLTVIDQYNKTELKKTPMRNPVFISCVNNLNGTCLNKSTMGNRAALGATIKKLIQRNKWENIELKTAKLNKQLKLVHNKGVRSTDYLIESFYGNASRKTLKCIQRNAPGQPYKISNPISTTDVASEIMVHLAIEEGKEMTKKEYKEAIKALKNHGGVAVKYLRNQRVTEFKKLRNYFHNCFPASEVGGFSEQFRV